MESEIGLHRYIEAGEYNGNLYGTHIQSVFKISATGMHCLLDVGGPALERLTKLGLPPIAVLVRSPSRASQDHTVRLLNLPIEAGDADNDEDDDTHGDREIVSRKMTTDQIREARMHEKTSGFLKHYSIYLTGTCCNSHHFEL